jgi:hypothetical protein
MTNEQIAAGLTKAQREALLYDGFWWTHSKSIAGKGPTLAALGRKGLTTDAFTHRISNLGLEVRAILMKEQTDAR